MEDINLSRYRKILAKWYSRIMNMIDESAPRYYHGLRLAQAWFHSNGEKLISQSTFNLFKPEKAQVFFDLENFFRLASQSSRFLPDDSLDVINEKIPNGIQEGVRFIKQRLSIKGPRSLRNNESVTVLVPGRKTSSNNPSAHQPTISKDDEKVIVNLTIPDPMVVQASVSDRVLVLEHAGADIAEIFRKSFAASIQVLDLYPKTVGAIINECIGVYLGLLTRHTYLVKEELIEAPKKANAYRVKIESKIKELNDLSSNAYYESALRAVKWIGENLEQNARCPYFDRSLGNFGLCLSESELLAAPELKRDFGPPDLFTVAKHASIKDEDLAKRIYNNIKQFDLFSKNRWSVFGDDIAHILTSGYIQIDPINAILDSSQFYDRLLAELHGAFEYLQEFSRIIHSTSKPDFFLVHIYHNIRRIDFLNYGDNVNSWKTSFHFKTCMFLLEMMRPILHHLADDLLNFLWICLECNIHKSKYYREIVEWYKPLAGQGYWYISHLTPSKKEKLKDIHPTAAGAQKDAEHASGLQSQNVSKYEVLRDLNSAGKDEDGCSKNQR